MWTHLRPDAVETLKDEKARASLKRYFAVMQNDKPAKHVIAKHLQAEFSEDDSMEELWRAHADLTKEYYDIEREIDISQNDFRKTPITKKSYLDLKIEIANRIMHCCSLCTRNCMANRIEGPRGYCGCGSDIMVSSIFEHVGEEPELVPSGTVFTMGCTMRCKHCQNYTISQWMETGEAYTPSNLAKEVERLRVNGCRNINLVGGEPTPWLPQWLETFKHVNINVPIVWNSNSYYSPETARLLSGFVDVYLLDFKYGRDECAERISDTVNYWKVCSRNHLEAKKHGELIIRILVLPNHIECCTRPIVEWISKNLDPRSRVNIMFQYRPEWRAHEIPELQRRLTKEEMEHTIRLSKEAELENVIT